MKPTTYNLQPTTYQQGFTLIELLTVISITALLTTVVVVNFRQLQASQELQAASDALVAKIREVQNFTLTGREVSPGETADAYEVTLTAPAQSYQINYDTGVPPKPLLETVSFSQNIELEEISVDGVPDASIVLRFEAPYGNILIDGSENKIARLVVNQLKKNQTRTVLIDGISGRIGPE